MKGGRSFQGRGGLNLAKRGAGGGEGRGGTGDLGSTGLHGLALPLDLTCI